MKFGVSTYSYYQALRSGELDILGVIGNIAEIGGEHVEIVPLGFDLTEELIQAIRRKADEVGIDISNYCVGANFAGKSEVEYEQEIDRVMGEVDIAAALGVKLMRHDVASSPDTSIGNFNKELPKLAEACRRIADYAATKGITTSVENHGYFLQASDRVQALLHATDRSNFKTTLDVGNFLCVDEDPASGVTNNIAYASMVHVKDFYVRHPESNLAEGWFRSSHGNYLRGAIVGHGDIDMRRVLGIVKKSGYDGYISVEFEGLEPCVFATQQGLNQLKTIWESL
ncbi:sugar phosphate isomerase/epimerase family protein [Paenibacillus lupini]|uniref:sugar phosphate isomerase/epimerase family protein n=1 Tax=Paenibacillus lupini TaxID=1450204 RepID=UPI00141E4B23|nr:sugar phosphate isomerase/epimerase family protein [Paenibacillus lupini]NIK23875.1 sugar phosphate isomerase/epimerase [Paenibacillus lupini]